MQIEWLKTASWLHGARVRGYLRLLALLNLTAIILLVATSRDGVDTNGFLLGTDFVSFWAVGKLLAGGLSPYDVAAHIRIQQELLPGGSGYAAFFYPPPFALLCRPLGYLPYFAALPIWIAASAAVFLAALRPWLAGLSLRIVLLAFIASPAVLLQAVHGQSTFLVAALLGGGTWLVVRGHAWTGGVLFGLAAIKPQFGLLVPLALLAGLQWRALLGAGLAVLGMAAATAAALGSKVWGDWLALNGGARLAMESGAIGFGKMQSTFAGARMLGLPIGPAYAAQVVFALVCALVLARAVRQVGFTQETGGALLVGTILATPFVLDYDLVLLAFPLAVLISGPARPWERSVCALTFAAPALARGLGIYAGFPIMVPLMMALFWLLIRRANETAKEKGAAFATPLSG